MKKRLPMSYSEATLIVLSTVCGIVSIGHFFDSGPGPDAIFSLGLSIMLLISAIAERIYKDVDID